MASAPTFDFPLQGKIVVVTGGGGGIGLSFAQHAHNKGANIILADLKLSGDGQEFSKSPNVTFTRCDVSKWAELENLVTVSKRSFGDTPDVYVANAGIFEPTWSCFWENTESERYAIMDINANHPIKLTRIAIRASLAAGKQSVVCITASMAGYTAHYEAPLYAASKHAVVGFARSMAPAQKIQGVKVVAICPGIVDTPIFRDHPEVAERFSVTAAISMSADEVANAMIELVEKGAYPGGTILEITQGGTRVIPEWNIEPPKDAQGTGFPEEAIEKALAPIVKKTQEERGSGKKA